MTKDKPRHDKPDKGKIVANQTGGRGHPGNQVLCLDGVVRDWHDAYPRPYWNDPKHWEACREAGTNR